MEGAICLNYPLSVRWFVSQLKSITGDNFKNFQTCFMKRGMWLSGNIYANYERQLFHHHKNIAFAMVAKTVKLL